MDLLKMDEKELVAKVVTGIVQLGEIPIARRKGIEVQIPAAEAAAKAAAEAAAKKTEGEDETE